MVCKYLTLYGSSTNIHIIMHLPKTLLSYLISVHDLIRVNRLSVNSIIKNTICNFILVHFMFNNYINFLIIFSSININSHIYLQFLSYNTPYKLFQSKNYLSDTSC